MVVCGIGCAEKAADPVVATFEMKQFESRLVFYASGKYEHYAADRDNPDKIAKYPFLTGTYVGTASNYVTNIKPQDRPVPETPLQKVYRTVVHEGVEYLLIEAGAIKFEKTKNPNELRHAYRRL